jgi:hypothetical protein
MPLSYLVVDVARRWNIIKIAAATIPKKEAEKTY